MENIEIRIAIAACLAVLVVIGHFTFGVKWYLKPMIESNIEPIPKATMQCVFHYVSVYLVMSAIALIVIGFGGHCDCNGSKAIVLSTGVNYLLFAAVQIAYAFKNKIPNPLLTMFQWTLFIPIAILCLTSWY